MGKHNEFNIASLFHHQLRSYYDSGQLYVAQIAQIPEDDNREWNPLGAKCH